MCYSQDIRIISNGVIAMNIGQQWRKVFLYTFAMILLILNANTVVRSAQTGLELCIYTVIPSLFPFIFLSILLNNTLSHIDFKILHPLGKLLGIPPGAENLLLLSFLGGYPTGAQAISDRWHSGTLERHSALRMMGFCNNAGPAFIFGMLSGLFADKKIPWIIWLIHISGACFVGCILPKSPAHEISSLKNSDITISAALEKGIKAITTVCGWVILFKVILGCITPYLCSIMGQTATIGICGILEISNGCLEAQNIPCEGLRFIYINTILSFGGLCVLGQTASVTSRLGLGFYVPGKILQAIFCLIVSQILQPILFLPEQRFIFNPYFLIILLLGALLMTWRLQAQKNSSIFCKIHV